MISAPAHWWRARDCATTSTKQAEIDSAQNAVDTLNAQLDTAQFRHDYGCAIEQPSDEPIIRQEPTPSRSALMQRCTNARNEEAPRCSKWRAMSTCVNNWPAPPWEVSLEFAGFRTLPAQCGCSSQVRHLARCELGATRDATKDQSYGG